LARKAQLYDNLQSKKAVVKKKVTAAPKMIKSGQPKGKIDVKQKAKDDAWKNLQKVGSKEAAVNYLLNK
jgi:lipopolysaccharide biosynthesis regulator YciM